MIEHRGCCLDMFSTFFGFGIIKDNIQRLHISQKLDIKGPHKLLQFALEHRTEI
jgi:hypothetical protein